MSGSSSGSGYYSPPPSPAYPNSSSSAFPILTLTSSPSLRRRRKAQSNAKAFNLTSSSTIFMGILFCLCILLFVLSMHVREVVSKAQKAKRLQRYSEEVTPLLLIFVIQWTPLNMATSGQAKMAIITGWIYYPEFLFSKKSQFLSKSGHINRMDRLSVDILSGVYCINLEARGRFQTPFWRRYQRPEGGRFSPVSKYRVTP